MNNVFPDNVTRLKAFVVANDDKIPKNPKTMKNAKANDPDTWGTFAEASAAVDAGKAKYIGLELRPEFGIVCIDIDAHGCTEDEAKNRFDGIICGPLMGGWMYTEQSSSGKGYHILALAKVEPINRKNTELDLEIWNTGKYVMLTGKYVTRCDSMKSKTQQMKRVIEQYFPEKPKAEGGENLHQAKKQSGENLQIPCTAGDENRHLPSNSAADVIQIAERSRNGELFKALMRGDTSAHNGDDSAADLALCNLLAFYTRKDADLMDQIFRSSGLMRPKWDTRRGTSTYGQQTIQRAIADATAVYGDRMTNYTQKSKNATSGPKIAVMPPDFTDAGNAEVFSAYAQDHLIFCDALGWLFWDGKRWNRNDHAATALALKFSGMMLDEAKDKNRAALHTEADAKAAYEETGTDEDKAKFESAKANSKQAKTYLAHAMHTRQANALHNMLDLSKPRLFIMADKLDADPFILNTEAGMVDLTNGTIYPHDRKKLCTKLAPSSPSDDGNKMWGDFLDLVTDGDGGLKGYLQMVAGMCAIGKVLHEGILLAVGGGRNGKSTFFNALSAVMGDYAGTIDAQLLTTERQNRGAALATLRGKRLVTCGELEEGQRLSVATLKRMASTDPLTIEEKFKQPETVQPSHHVCLFSNFLPRVGSTDGGTWRRLSVVPFNATMPSGGNDIPNYADVLAHDAGGAILQWTIDGAVLFVRNGCKLQEPDVVAEATEQYQTRENWLQLFISERCVMEPNARVGAGELYDQYKRYTEECGDYCRRLTDFTAAMEGAGFQKITPKNKRTWLGLRIDYAVNYCGTTVS